MKKFLAFVKKEFKHLLRDPRTVLILFGIPVTQLLIFGYVISTEIKNAKIGILDYAKDEVSIELTNKILSSGYFMLEEDLHSANGMERLFQKGNTMLVLVFEPDFGNNLMKEQEANLQIITDASDPNTAALLENYIRGIVGNYMIDKSGGGVELISAPYRMYFNEDLKSSSNFVPGSMVLILMLISAMMTSISIVKEKELGTMEVLLVSPLRPLQIILGKVVPYLSLSMINMLVILAIGFFVFEVPIRGSLILLLFVTLLFILLALSLGIMISTIANTQQTAMVISLMGLMLPTMLLSGFIFPLRNMPEILQYVSLLMPPRWFLEVLRNIMLKGSDVTLVWKEILILIVMLVFFIGVSVKKFKVRIA